MNENIVKPESRLKRVCRENWPYWLGLLAALAIMALARLH
jgi:hypothetical protein